MKKTAIILLFLFVLPVMASAADNTLRGSDLRVNAPWVDSRNFQTLTAANAYAVSKGFRLKIYANTSLSGDTTLTASTMIEPGGRITCNGHNLVVSDKFSAPEFYQAFDCPSGAVTFTSLVPEITAAWWGTAGDGTTDDTTAIQTAAAALTSGQTLILPGPTHKVTSYISVTGLSNIKIKMRGEIKPVGTLNSLSNGLFNISSCTDVKIIPKVKNATYASTINVIRLVSTSKVEIYNGIIDLKYNSYDGTAAIQIGANTSDVEVRKNYIRSGYGVLGNDVAGVSNIRVVGNTIVGQHTYGDTGTGDAVEANFPTYGSSAWQIDGNKISGYRLHNPGGAAARTICIGLANVTGYSVTNNTFSDSDQESVHVENGSSNGIIAGNKGDTGIMGVVLQPNTPADMVNTVISGNQFSMPVMPSDSAYSADYGACILLNVNNTSTGVIKNVTVENNVCSGVTGASRGIVAYSVDGFSLVGNIARGFPRSGFDIRNFHGLGPATTPTNGIIKGNQAIDNGWNYILGGLGVGGEGLLTNTYFDESNRATGSLFNQDYDSQITTRTGSTIRIPYTSKATLSAGDLVVYSDGRYGHVLTGGVYGVWQVSDGTATYTKSGPWTTNSVALTWGSFGAYSKSAIVELKAQGIASNGTNQQAYSAKYIIRHISGGAVNTLWGTPDTYGPPITVTAWSTIAPVPRSGYDIWFTGVNTHSITTTIYQGDIHNPDIGGLINVQ